MLFLSLRLIFGYRRISVYHSCVHMSNTVVIPDIICVCTSIEWVTQSKQQIKQTSKCRMGTGWSKAIEGGTEGQKSQYNDKIIL